MCIFIVLFVLLLFCFCLGGERSFVFFVFCFCFFNSLCLTLNITVLIFRGKFGCYQCVAFKSSPVVAQRGLPVNFATAVCLADFLFHCKTANPSTPPCMVTVKYEGFVSEEHLA